MKLFCCVFILVYSFLIHAAKNKTTQVKLFHPIFGEGTIEKYNSHDPKKNHYPVFFKHAKPNESNEFTEIMSKEWVEWGIEKRNWLERNNLNADHPSLRLGEKYKCDNKPGKFFHYHYDEVEKRRTRRVNTYKEIAPQLDDRGIEIDGLQIGRNYLLAEGKRKLFVTIDSIGLDRWVELKKSKLNKNNKRVAAGTIFLPIDLAKEYLKKIELLKIGPLVENSKFHDQASNKKGTVVGFYEIEVGEKKKTLVLFSPHQKGLEKLLSNLRMGDNDLEFVAYNKKHFLAEAETCQEVAARKLIVEEEVLFINF